MSFDGHFFWFQIFPYLALFVLIVGSILRFDREPYSWRSKSSQLLRRRALIWGSTLFHVGILFLFLGHLVGLLTPHAVYSALGLTASAKQMVAIVTGGAFGILCFLGLTILLWRRLFDRRIRANSSAMDIFVLLLLYVQLILGLGTIPFSLQHTDGSVMIALAEWAQHIVTFRGGADELVRAVPLIYKLHLVLGLFLFMVFPFTRLVHFFSAPIWYIFRKQYQIVRRREV